MKSKGHKNTMLRLDLDVYAQNNVVVTVASQHITSNAGCMRCGLKFFHY